MSHFNASRWITLAALAWASLCPVAQAQSQDIELFDQTQFNGTRLRLPGDTPDVGAYGIGGRVASVVVQRGRWEFCTAAQYAGVCITVGPGRYAELPLALRGSLASLRRADSVAMPQQPPAPPPPPPQPHAHPQPQPQIMPPVASPGGPGMPPRHGGGRWDGRGPIFNPLPPAPGHSGDAVVLYEHANFDGRALGLNNVAARLGEFDFNDRASSMLVHRGRWQICEHSDFAGECWSFGPGRHVLSGRLNDIASSIRPVFGNDNRPLPRHGALVLHENVDFSGRQLMLIDGLNNLRAVAMNDVASAVEVWGGPWEMCTDADFAGQCVVVAPGRYRLEGPFNDRVSSARPRR